MWEEKIGETTHCASTIQVLLTVPVDVVFGEERRLTRMASDICFIVTPRFGTILFFCSFSTFSSSPSSPFLTLCLSPFH